MYGIINIEMCMNNKIGVFDSGIGGMSTLNEIRKLLPNEAPEKQGVSLKIV